LQRWRSRQNLLLRSHRGDALNDPNVRSTAYLAFISSCTTIVAVRECSLGQFAWCNQVQGAAATTALAAITATWFL
jgi:hypothetical protein